MQSVVNQFMAFGVPGELYDDSPWRGQPAILDSTGPNTIGFATTLVAATATADGVPIHVNIGGTGPFAGILANPKEQALFGTTAGPLTPTLNLPQYSTAALYTMGHIVVEVSDAVSVNDVCDFVQSGGALVARTAAWTPSAGTAAVATSVLTIASLAGNASAITVGSIVPTLHGPATVLAVLTGTGGNGTYTVQAGLSDSAATAITTPVVTAPASGNTHIDGSKFVQYGEASAGLCVLQLT